MERSPENRLVVPDTRRRRSRIGVGGTDHCSRRKARHLLDAELRSGFDEAQASNIVLCDDDLNLLEGDGMVNPSNRFHLWIYRHRPNVNAIIHTHPPYCLRFRLTRRAASRRRAHGHLDVLRRLRCFCRTGRATGDRSEGEIIHNALGNNRSILLAHHGQLCACSTMEEAAVLSIFIERAARMQLMARAVGPIKQLDPAARERSPRPRLKPKAIGATFHYFRAARILRRLGGAAVRCRSEQRRPSGHRLHSQGVKRALRQVAAARSEQKARLIRKPCTLTSHATPPRPRLPLFKSRSPGLSNALTTRCWHSGDDRNSRCSHPLHAYSSLL